MPIPVPIPGGPLSITEEDNTKAEAIVAAMAQIIKSGTTGASINTPSVLIPDSSASSPTLVSPEISSAEQQLFYRQLALAVVKGIEASGSGSYSTSSVFTATCLSTDAVGDIVYVSNTNTVAKADIQLDASMPGVGVIVEKTDSVTCKVQVSGVISNLYTGLTPGDTYFVGLDSRPTNTRPVPGIGEEYRIQVIGVAVNSTDLVIGSNFTITVVRG